MWTQINIVCIIDFVNFSSDVQRRQLCSDWRLKGYIMVLLPYAWVKVFRIIPEFRILRLTFHRKSALKDYSNNSPLFSVSLKTIDHLR